MKPEEQRLAIAEACGWREAFPSSGPPHPETKRGGILLPYHWVNEKSHAREMELPDYLNDLNACAEMAKVLESDWDKFDAYARRICMMPIIVEGESSTLFDEWGLYGLLKATASQRAEAFLRTLGLWKESP